MVRYGFSDWLGQIPSPKLKLVEMSITKGQFCLIIRLIFSHIFFILVGITSWLSVLPFCTVSGCGVIIFLRWPQKDLVWPCTVGSIRHDNSDVTFEQQFQKGLCDPVVKKGRPWFGSVLPQRFVGHQTEAAAAVSSYIRPSDKVEETWLAFLQQQRAADSTHGRCLSVWKPFFPTCSFFLCIFQNLLVPARFVSMSQYVAGTSPRPPFLVSRQDKDKRPQCSQRRRCSGVEVLTPPNTLQQNSFGSARPPRQQVTGRILDLTWGKRQTKATRSCWRRERGLRHRKTGERLDLESKVSLLLLLLFYFISTQDEAAGF